MGTLFVCMFFKVGLSRAISKDYVGLSPGGLLRVRPSRVYKHKFMVLENVMVMVCVIEQKYTF